MKTDLVRRAMAGDHDAFVRIVDEALPGLYASATSILRDRSVAEEAVQEAMIRAWRSFPSLRDPQRVDAWLYRLLVRSCMDQGRRLSRMRKRTERLEGGAELSTLDSTAFIPERDEVLGAIGHLSLDQRAIVVLVYERGYTLTEVAEILSTPLGTVKSRLNRALEALRADLGAAHHQEEGA
jgi:RNA polymerase sigma-70 factor (ECF subfamily)